MAEGDRDPLRELGRIDATVEFTAKSDNYLRGSYPLVTVAMPPTHEIIDKYLKRDSLHVSFPLRGERVPRGIVRDVIVKALEHGVDREDQAFSPHAMEHGVAQEAVNRLTDQLNTDPSQVRLTLERRLFESSDSQQNSWVTSFVLDSAPEERSIYRPLYIEVGEQLQRELDKYGDKREEKTKQLRKRMKNLTETVGVDFAVLACTTAGVLPPDTLSVFQDLQRIGLQRVPSTSRPEELQNIWAIRNALYPDETLLTYDARQQNVAMSLAQQRKGWGHASEEFWQMYKSPQLVTSRAVLGGKNYAAAKYLDTTIPEFRNPMKQRYLDGLDKNATSQLVTAYNLYEPLPNSARLLTGEEIRTVLPPRK